MSNWKKQAAPYHLHDKAPSSDTSLLYNRTAGRLGICHQFPPILYSKLERRPNTNIVNI